MRVIEYIHDKYYSMRSCLEPGETVPDIPLDAYIGGKLRSTTLHELFLKKRVLLLTVPSAFSVTCAKYYISGFQSYLAQFNQLGVEIIACLAPNSAEVLKIWSDMIDPEQHIQMIPDQYGDIALELGIAISARGCGLVPKRTIFYIEDLKVRFVLVKPNSIQCIDSGASVSYEILKRELHQNH